MGTVRIDNGPNEVGSKGWDWSMGSIQDPWYAGFHPRAARKRAMRAFLVKYLYVRSEPERALEARRSVSASFCNSKTNQLRGLEGLRVNSKSPPRF